MSRLRAPSIGPIVGHTTDTSCRLWIRGAGRGDSGSDLSEDRRTVGVISIIEVDGVAVPNAQGRAYYFRLHREYDRTGTFNLGVDNSFKKPGQKIVPLKPNTSYVVRMGSLTLDDPIANDDTAESSDLSDRMPAASVWIHDLTNLDPKTCEASFRTYESREKPDADLSFLLGSCRYPGLLWKRKHADKIFRPMNEHVEAGDISFVLLVGDQIYADMLNKNIPIGLADTFEEFQERYHSAFGSPNMAKLLRSCPHYMILDDHEIADNWTQDQIEEKRFLFNLAIGSYCSYQWSHCPRNFGSRLYYSFECEGYPFFVLDGRTDRYKGDDDSLDDNHLLGLPSFSGDDPSQLEILLSWLDEQQAKIGDAPKFIVSASVFVPNNVKTTKGDDKKRLLKQHASDSWPAFPKTRKALLQKIVNRGVQNVVFLSGDVHCSNVAEMTFSGTAEAERLKVFSVTSSALYWPFFFADGEPSHYVHDSEDEDTPDTFKVNDAVSMNYTAKGFTQEDNFCRLKVDRGGHQLVIEVFGKDGKPIKKKNKKLRTEFTLAEW